MKLIFALLRRESYEELLQVQLWVLREGDLYPQWWVEVIHVDVKCGLSRVVLCSELVV
jgi:hypothetical protein